MVRRLWAPAPLARMAKAAVHSFETAGTLDGPGIRFVLFLKGCPLRCLFCHNPDTWADTKAKTLSAEEIFSEIKKYIPFFNASGGGVTVSGGEPLLQADFLTEFLEILRENSVNSAIDTCGYVDIDAKIKRVADLADMFLLDVKHADESGHIMLTGRPPEKPRRFLEFLCEKNKKLWIRCVLINGITAEPEYAKMLGNYLKPYGDKIERIELLPYHRLGVGKWKKLGLDYKLEGVEPTSRETVENFKKVLREFVPVKEIV